MTYDITIKKPLLTWVTACDVMKKLDLEHYIALLGTLVGLICSIG